MKKSPFILITLLFFSSVIGSETQKVSSSKMNNKELRNSSLLIGGNYSHVNIDPNNGSSLNGNLGGIHALYEYQPANALYAGVKFNWRQGNTSGTAGNLFLTDYDMTERLGYTWENNKWLITLFSGFGLRILKHHQKFSGGFFSNSVKIDYYEFYFPVGFLSEYAFSSWFSLGAYITWMAQAFPSAQIRPFGGAYWELTRTFGNFRIETPIIFKWMECRCFSLVLNPFYERWQDGHSTATTSTGIPLGLQKNTYHFFGADLNLIYFF